MATAKSSKHGPVYSYVRFSSIKQAQGTGQKRQEDAAAAWCRARGLALVRDYQDLGISGFKGRNVTEGALAAFLRAIEAGIVPSGATLLVENLDRLSRQQVNKAVELFLSIVNRGIRVVTLCDGAEYTDEKCDLPSLMMSLVIFSRANEESQTKSQRALASRRYWIENATARQAAALPGRRPSWLEVVDGTRYRVVEQDRLLKLSNGMVRKKPGAQTVRAAFADMAAGVGTLTVADKYGIPPATVKLWTTTRAVLGTLAVTTEGRNRVEIPGHYPPIVSESVFNTVRATRAQRAQHRLGAGPGGAAVGLLSGLLRNKHGVRFEFQYAKPPDGRKGPYVYGDRHGIYVQADHVERAICCHVLLSRCVRQVAASARTPVAAPEVKALEARAKQLAELLTTADPLTLPDITGALRKVRIKLGRMSPVSSAIGPVPVRLDAVTQMWLGIDDRGTRLELRQILRETVRSIVLYRSIGDVWVRLVGGIITLYDERTIGFSVGYCTRSKGFVVAFQNSKSDWIAEGPRNPKCWIDNDAVEDLIAGKLTPHLRASLLRMTGVS
jgi:DNA invertase Pin-like site-specific DNA recombinase